MDPAHLSVPREGEGRGGRERMGTEGTTTHTHTARSPGGLVVSMV